MEFKIVIDDGVLRACWLASLAHACGWKRACRHYLLDAQILMTVPARASDDAHQLNDADR
jgi:hypothetical protein